MFIGITEDRKRIHGIYTSQGTGDLVHNHFSALDQLEEDFPVEVFELPGIPGDCHDYVVSRLDLVSKLELIPLFNPSRIKHTPEEGDVVGYFRYDPTENLYRRLHTGLILNGEVLSKWYDYGPILKHPVETVPSTWGDTVVFTPPNS